MKRITLRAAIAALLTLGGTLLARTAAADAGTSAFELAPDDAALTAFAATGGWVDYPPAVAYNPEDDEYLVVFTGTAPEQGMAPEEQELFAQRLDGATRTPLGTSVRLTEMGGLGHEDFEAREPQVVWNPLSAEYLVVFEGRQTAFDGEEIFAVRVTRDGRRLPGVQQVSIAGGPFEPHYDAHDPTVAHDPVRNRYLVAWSGTERDPALDSGQRAIFVRPLDAGLATLDVAVRISAQSAVADPYASAFAPAVSYDPSADAWAVAWSGREGADDATSDVYVRHLATDLLGAGPVHRLSPGHQPSFAPDLVADPAVGGVVVAWESRVYDRTVVMSRRVDAHDGPALSRRQLSSTDASAPRDAEDPVLRARPGGGFLLAYLGGSPDPATGRTQSDVYLVRLDADLYSDDDPPIRLSAQGDPSRGIEPEGVALALRDRDEALAIWVPFVPEAAVDALAPEVYGQGIDVEPSRIDDELFAHSFETPR